MFDEAGRDVPGNWYYHASMPSYGIENCSDCVWEGEAVRWAGAQGIAFTISLPRVPLELVMTGVRFDGGRQITQMNLTFHDLKLKAVSDGSGAYAWNLPYPVSAPWIKCVIHAEGVSPDADVSQLFCFSGITVRRRRG